MMTPIPSRPLSALPPRNAAARFLMTQAVAGGDRYQAVMLAKEFRDTPQVSAAIEALQTKTAVSPLTLASATAAGPLAPYGIFTDALSLPRGPSVVGQLAAKFRRAPFRVTVPRETGNGIGGGWIREGLATPLTLTRYDTVTVEAYKFIGLAALSRELLLIGNPAAEKTVIDTVARQPRRPGRCATARPDGRPQRGRTTRFADERHHECHPNRHIERGDGDGFRQPGRRDHHEWRRLGVGDASENRRANRADARRHRERYAAHVSRDSGHRQRERARANHAD